MINIKSLIPFSFSCFLISSCELQKAKSDASKEDYFVETDEGQLNITQLNKDQEQLLVLSLDQAKVKYGNLDEKEIIKIKKDSIAYTLEELVKKHYPNREYETSNVEIIEVAWFFQNKSWIQVWYKLENQVWVPIDSLLSV